MVTYTLLDSPHYGALTLNQGGRQGGFRLPGRALTHGDAFSQDDANKGRLTYRAVAEVGRSQVTEKLPLRIADSSGSRYRPQLLAITVAPTDNQVRLNVLQICARIMENTKSKYALSLSLSLFFFFFFCTII